MRRGKPRLYNKILEKQAGGLLRLFLAQQVVNHITTCGCTVGAGDARDEGEERFIDLGSLGLLRKKKVGQPFHDWHEHSDQQHPTSWSVRAENAEKHVRRQDYHCGEPEVADCGIEPSREGSRERCEQIIKTAVRGHSCGSFA